MTAAIIEPVPQVRASEALFQALGSLVLTFMTGLGIVLMFVLSAMALFHFGLNYEAPGGSFIEKIHPGSWLIFLALLLAMLGHGNPVRFLDQVVPRHPGLALFLVTWVLLLVQVIVVQKAPFTPLIDTFLMPIALVVLIDRLSETAKRNLARIVHLIFFANALLGLYEFIAGYRLTPYFAGTVEILDDWRSTSLFGHPLANAILSGSYIVAICVGGARDLPGFLRPATIVLQLSAMVAFGGRSSLVLALVFVGLSGIFRAGAVLRGRKVNLAGAACVMLLAPLALLAFANIAGSGFFDQLLLRFVDDNGSAKARLVLLHLFEIIPVRDIILGPDPSYLASLLRQEGSEYGLESFWLATILSYGLVISLIFFAGLFAFCRDLVVASKPGSVWVLVFFFIIASTSVSLSAKTCVFGLIVTILLILLRPAHKASTLSA